MNHGKTYAELKKNLDALSEDIPEVVAARTAAAAKIVEAYSHAFW